MEYIITEIYVDRDEVTHLKLSSKHKWKYINTSLTDFAVPGISSVSFSGLKVGDDIDLNMLMSKIVMEDISTIRDTLLMHYKIAATTTSFSEFSDFFSKNQGGNNNVDVAEIKLCSTSKNRIALTFIWDNFNSATLIADRLQ